jgi:hypothetical protein
VVLRLSHHDLWSGHLAGTLSFAISPSLRFMAASRDISSLEYVLRSTCLQVFRWREKQEMIRYRKERLLEPTVDLPPHLTYVACIQLALWAPHYTP